MKSSIHFKQDYDGGGAPIVLFGLALMLNFPVAAYFHRAAWLSLPNV